MKMKLIFAASIFALAVSADAQFGASANPSLATPKAATKPEPDESALRLAALAWEEKMIELTTAGTEAIRRMISAVRAGDKREYASGGEALLGAIDRMTVHTKRAEVLEVGMGKEARANFRDEATRLYAMQTAALDRANKELEAARNSGAQTQPLSNGGITLEDKAAERMRETPNRGEARLNHPHGANGARADAALQWAEQQRTAAAQAQAAELRRIAEELARLRR